MADTFLGSFRRLVVDVVSERCTPPVYPYLPDDIAHVPVLVVGRPSARESGIPAVMILELDVTLLGRRIADDDAQAELDAYGDELWFALGGTRGRKVGDSHLACRLVTPGTVLVAGLEHPAYIATVSTDALSC
jgi:hypothetical protein